MFYMLSPFVNPSLFSNPAAPKCLIRCLFGFCCLLWGNEIQAADEYLHLGYFKGLVLCGSSGLSPCPVFWFGFNWWEQALWVLEIWKQGAHPVADRITGVWGKWVSDFEQLHGQEVNAMNWKTLLSQRRILLLFSCLHSLLLEGYLQVQAHRGTEDVLSSWLDSYQGILCAGYTSIKE